MKKLHSEREVNKNFFKCIFTILLCIIIFITNSLILNVNYSKAATIEPQENQKVEYRATELNKTDNGNQLIIEIWLHNLNFKGMDLRLEYDENILKPSKLSTNEIIDVNSELTIPSCFEFANGFGGYLDYFAMEMTDNEYRGILSMVGKGDRTGTNEYLIEDDDIGDYVSINGDVLLAKLSFNVGDSTKEDITTQSLKLKEASTSPQTGIKVNVNGTDSYEAQKLFEFTLDLEDPERAITGKIQLGDGLRESMETSYGVTTKYIADIKLYTAGEFNFDGIITEETNLDELDSIESVASTTSDDEGNYTLQVKPGTYDCIIERKGFLAQVIKNITIAPEENINLGDRILIEGDANRSGTIDLDDMIEIVNFTGLTINDDDYDERYDYGQKGFIGLDDLVSTTNNMYNTISVEEYTPST